MNNMNNKGTTSVFQPLSWKVFLYLLRKDIRRQCCSHQCLQDAFQQDNQRLNLIHRVIQNVYLKHIRVMLQSLKRSCGSCLVYSSSEKVVQSVAQETDWFLCSPVAELLYGHPRQCVIHSARRRNARVNSKDS